MKCIKEGCTDEAPTGLYCGIHTPSSGGANYWRIEDTQVPSDGGEEAPEIEQEWDHSKYEG